MRGFILFGLAATVMMFGACGDSPSVGPIDQGTVPADLPLSKPDAGVPPSLDQGIQPSDPDTGVEQRPTWVLDKMGPWDQDLYVYDSDDGLNFTERELLVKHAGVPHLLQDKSGTLIAVYQYFSFSDEALFNVFAYSTSADLGLTWDGPHLLEVKDLPEPVAPEASAVDPTIVELDDGSLRLYFTYHLSGKKSPVCVSAKAQSIKDAFVYEEGIRVELENTTVLDPAVVYFKGTWHYFAPENTMAGPSTLNLHATSSDGLNFELQEKIDLGGPRLLGSAIVVDDGLRFYGTNQGAPGAFSAISTDGFSWKTEAGERAPHGDPGVVKLSNGKFLLLSAGGQMGAPPPPKP